MSARSYTRRQLMMDEVKAKPYISDGLVFHMDGADCNGTTWPARVGNVTYTLNGGTADGVGVTFNSGTNSQYASGSSTPEGIKGTVGTIEVCAYRRSARGTTYPEILFISSKIPNIQYVVHQSGDYVAISNRNTDPTPRAPINGKTVGKFTHSCNAVRTCYNGTMVTVGSTTYLTNQANYIGGNGSSGAFKGTIYQIRIYNRQLTEAEMKWNQQQDAKRYGITLG